MKSIDREHVCAFTGHRPEKLAIPEADVIAWLDKEIREAVDDSYTKFISGMQRGVDIWAAELVLKLRNEGQPIQLIAASAFRRMENRWETIGRNATKISYLPRMKRITSEIVRGGRHFLIEITGWLTGLLGCWRFLTVRPVERRKRFAMRRHIETDRALFGRQGRYQRTDAYLAKQ